MSLFFSISRLHLMSAKRWWMWSDVLPKSVSYPLTVGGGIRTVEDMREMLMAGADKVGINTAAVNRPELINEGATAFGNQCIVVAIDAKREGPGKWGVYTHGGRTAVGLRCR